MKRYPVRIALLLIILASFLSCSKGNKSGYYVKIKLNGNWITLQHSIGELRNEPAESYFFVGASDEGIHSFNIEMYINDPALSTGTFDTSDPAISLHMSYGKGTDPNIEYFEVASLPGQPVSRYILNITSATAKDLRGNFTGNYLTNIYTDETVVVTEGEFFVKRYY